METMRQERTAGQERSAWLGAQIGGSAWLIVGGLVLLEPAPYIGLAFLGFGLAANAIGIGLWRRRRSMGLRRALVALVLVTGALSLGALGVADAGGQLAVLWRYSGVGAPVPIRWTYLIVIVYPVMAGLLAVRSEQDAGGA